MRITIALLIVLIACISPTTAQNQSDAATRQDIEELIQLTGARDQMNTISADMASQMASVAVERYKLQHPDADAAELQNVATDASERVQQALKSIPADEVVGILIPVYQKYLTHSDIKAMKEFYATPTGQKLLKNSSAMTIEVMQATFTAMKKYMPEMQDPADKAPQKPVQPTPAQPKQF